MHKLFRKKTHVVPEVKPKQIEQQEIPFSMNHPYLSNSKKISGLEIKSNNAKYQGFQKLNTIFITNPKLADYITFYSFENSVNPNYIEYRQWALKFQIKTGIDQVLSFENSINKRTDFTIEKINKSDYQNYIYLYEVRNEWNQYLSEYIIEQQIKDEINRISAIKLNGFKNITIQLTSLLASIDSLPINCIPIVNFNELMHSKEDLINNDSQCDKLLNYLNEIPKKSNHREKIEVLLNKYSDVTPSDQISQFGEMLHQYSMVYDSQNHNLMSMPDISQFHDFISHPKSISYPIYNEFINKISPISYRDFVSQLISLFKVQASDFFLFHFLCSLSFVVYRDSLKPPSIDLDVGINDDMFMIAFEVVISFDPIWSLYIFAKNSQSMNIDEFVTGIINHLKYLTSEWKELLRFIGDYTINDFLPQHLRDIRNLILKSLDNCE